MAQEPELTQHLFCITPQAKNYFNIFKWLKKLKIFGSTRKLCEIQILEHIYTYSFPIGLILLYRAELSSCNRDYMICKA